MTFSRQTPRLRDSSQEFQSNINDETAINEDDQSDSGKEDLIHQDDQREEEWGGISDAGKQAEEEAMAYEHRTGTKPKKLPTGHELRTIKDATDLFKSSSFKLQV